MHIIVHTTGTNIDNVTYDGYDSAYKALLKSNQGFSSLPFSQQITQSIEIWNQVFDKIQRNPRGYLYRQKLTVDGNSICVVEDWETHEVVYESSEEDLIKRGVIEYEGDTNGLFLYLVDTSILKRCDFIIPQGISAKTVQK